MILSVIIPVYNASKYLIKCIQSIAEQDINIIDYEILAINDGSTDDSLAVLNNLKNNYSNLKIITQENQGLSGARNTGLENSNGSFVLFVDADDYILPNVLKDLISLAKENEVDILEFGAQGVSEHGKITYSVKNSTNENVLSGENYLSSIDYMGSACNKLYNLNFLKKHNLKFMPNVYIEDIEFNTRAVFFSKKILAIDKVIAHFLQREGSITRTKDFDKKKKMIYDIFIVLNSINDFAEKKVTQKSIAYIPLKKRVSALISTMLLRVLKDTKSIKIKNDIISMLKEKKIYPTKFKPKSKDKQLFLYFANNYVFFSLACYFITKFNKLRYGK